MTKTPLCKRLSEIEILMHYKNIRIWSIKMKYLRYKWNATPALAMPDGNGSLFDRSLSNT